MNLETVGPTGSDVSGGWFQKEFDLSAVAGFVPSDQFRIRFLVSDLSDGSVIEAGVDGLTLGGVFCDGGTDCASDLNGDGVVSVNDLLELIGNWGPCSGCDEDINGSGTVDVSDLLTLIADWGPCE
jgi:hypothetical protein